MPPPTLRDVLERLKLFVDADDVRYVLTSKELTRSAFFQEAHWAVLVSQRDNDTANEWCRKAKEYGFPFDWRSLAAWSDAEFKSWCKRMAKILVVPKSDSCHVAEYSIRGQHRERVRGARTARHL